VGRAGAAAGRVSSGRCERALTDSTDRVMALGGESREEVVRNKGSVLRAVPMHRLVRVNDVSNTPGQANCFGRAELTTRSSADDGHCGGAPDARLPRSSWIPLRRYDQTPGRSLKLRRCHSTLWFCADTPKQRTDSRTERTRPPIVTPLTHRGSSSYGQIHVHSLPVAVLRGMADTRATLL